MYAMAIFVIARMHFKGLNIRRKYIFNQILAKAEDQQIQQ
jgi:hypothetical protein